jgi:uncharacterized protein HemX
MSDSELRELFSKIEEIRLGQAILSERLDALRSELGQHLEEHREARQLRKHGLVRVVVALVIAVLVGLGSYFVGAVRAELEAARDQGRNQQTDPAANAAAGPQTP